MNYFWVRIFDYRKEEVLEKLSNDYSLDVDKGTLLDEYYLCGEDMTRDIAKKTVSEKSGCNKFAKPRKSDGIYALVMESNQFFYDRFNVNIDTICFNCYKTINGKMKNFPYITDDKEDKYFFCSWDCKHTVVNKINPYYEGEFQEREGYEINGGVYGYIYHIYNRKTNMHYIGQTVYMPFFRWQEHAKSGLKGDITDLIFETITEVRVKSREYLNSIEAWWIRKFIDEYGKDRVMNITVPKITIEQLISEYSKIASGQLTIESEVV